MYQQIDLLPELLPEAEQFVIDNDRDLYRPFFVAIEKWCGQRGVLIGGRMGVLLLTGQPIDKDSYKWELYMESPFAMGKELADELYKVKSPHIPSKYVSLITNIKNRELTIAINTQLLVKIYGLRHGRNFRMADAVGSTERPGFFTGDPVRCVPEELQLIDIYKKLYSPAFVKEWPALLDTENSLVSGRSDIVGAADEADAINIIGADDESGDDESGNESDDDWAIDDCCDNYDDAKIGGRVKRRRVAKQRSAHHDTKTSLRDIEQIIVDVLPSANSVVVGDYAMTRAGISPLPRQPRLSILTAMDIDELSKMIRAGVAESMPNLSLYTTHRTHPLSLPTDFQIIKYTLYVSIGDNKSVSIADIYNSPSYELVPVEVNSAGLQYPNPWVILRFRFIELWVIKIVSYIDNNPIWSEKIKYINQSIDRLRRHTLGRPIEELFVPNYIGIFTVEAAAKKKFIKDIGERYNAYLPARGEKINNDEES